MDLIQVFRRTRYLSTQRTLVVATGAVLLVLPHLALADIVIQAKPGELTLFAPEEPALAKLAPELMLAVSSKGQFLGFGDEGRTLLSFPDEVGHQGALDALLALGASDIAPLRQSEVAGLTAARPDDIGAQPTEQPILLEEVIVLTESVTPVTTGLLGEYAISERSETLGFVTVQKQGGFAANELLQLAQRPDTLFVEPNYHLQLFASEPNDPHYLAGKQWGLDAAGFPIAWGEGLTNTEAVVAVIDTGMAYTHEDIAPNIWRNEDGEVGYDFVENDNDPAPIPTVAHATQVAGILGAVGNNSKHMTGGAWKVRIMPIRIFGGLSGSADAAAKGINYAVENGADVINISWGTDFGQEPKVLRKAIQRAEDDGVLVVAAAGNRGWDIDQEKPVYPIGYPNANIIGVAAHTRKDELWKGPAGNESNFGQTSVDLAAPGEDIFSLLPSDETPFDTIDDINDDGTSLAAPYVSAAAAIVLSRVRSENPDLPRTELVERVRNMLLRNVRPSSGLTSAVVTGGSLHLAFLEADGRPSEASDRLTSVSGRLVLPTVSIGAMGGGAIIETETGTVEIGLRNDKQLADYLQSLHGENVVLQGYWTTEETAPVGSVDVFIPETSLSP